MSADYGKEMYKPRIVTVTWSATQTTSDEFEIPDGMVVVALETGGSINAATAVVPHGYAGEDDGSFKASDLSITIAAADTIHKVAPADSCWLRKGKLVADTAQTSGWKMWLHVRPAT